MNHSGEWHSPTTSAIAATFLCYQLPPVFFFHPTANCHQLGESTSGEREAVSIGEVKAVAELGRCKSG